MTRVQHASLYVLSRHTRHISNPCSDQGLYRVTHSRRSCMPPPPPRADTGSFTCQCATCAPPVRHGLTGHGNGQPSLVPLAGEATVLCSCDLTDGSVRPWPWRGSRGLLGPQRRPPMGAVWLKRSRLWLRRPRRAPRRHLRKPRSPRAPRPPTLGTRGGTWAGTHPSCRASCARASSPSPRGAPR